MFTLTYILTHALPTSAFRHAPGNVVCFSFLAALSYSYFVEAMNAYTLSYFKFNIGISLLLAVGSIRAYFWIRYAGIDNHNSFIFPSISYKDAAIITIITTSSTS